MYKSMYITLLKEIKDLNKWRDIHVHEKEDDIIKI